MGNYVDLIEPVRVLHGHTSPETAFVVEDYPYGRQLRCRRRIWVETAVKGAKKGLQRVVTQTTNPKVMGREVWNKPHPGQYDPIVWLYEVLAEGEEQGHIKHITADLYLSPAHDARLRLMGVFDAMTEPERRRYGVLLNVSHSHQPPWDEWDEQVRAVLGHLRETGSLPEWTDRRVLGLYVPEWNWPVLASLAVRIAADDAAAAAENTTR